MEESLEPIVLTDIPTNYELPAIIQRLHIQPGTSQEEELAQLIQGARRVARPKALYRLGFIAERGDDHVVIDGVLLNSRVLRVNLEDTHRVFLYVATCGTEIDAWSAGLDDMLHQYWAETLKEVALRAATRALHKDVTDRFRPGKTSNMAPGSLQDWPITQQRPLFRLLGDPEASIGVHLTSSCLMVPNKSVSGIRFTTEMSFQSCQLCPRAVCENRRAPYDQDLYERRYRLSES